MLFSSVMNNDCWVHLMHNMTQNVHDKKHSRVPPSSRESPASQPEGRNWKPLVIQGQTGAKQDSTVT